MFDCNSITSYDHITIRDFQSIFNQFPLWPKTISYPPAWSSRYDSWVGNVHINYLMFPGKAFTGPTDMSATTAAQDMVGGGAAALRPRTGHRKSKRWCGCWLCSTKRARAPPRVSDTVFQMCRPVQRYGWFHCTITAKFGGIVKNVICRKWNARKWDAVPHVFERENIIDQLIVSLTGRTTANQRASGPHTLYLCMFYARI